MATLIYVDGRSLPWAYRWLQENERKETVILASADAAEHITAFLCSASSDVKVMVANPNGQDDARLARDLLRFIPHQYEIVLPCSLPARQLDMFPTDYLPDMRPIYPLLCRFHSLGIRRFTFWSGFGSFTLDMPHLFRSFTNRHAGRRAFVVGNGPSLRRTQMSLLKDELTFGSNRCFLGFEDWGFPFTYWGVYDEVQAFAYGHEYQQALPDDIIKFCPLHFFPLLKTKNLCPVSLAPTTWKSDFAAREPLAEGHSVTYMLLQIAASMGCNPIVLVGVDHYYPLKEQRLRQIKRNVREAVIRPFRSTKLYRAVKSKRTCHRAETAASSEAGGTWDRTMAIGETHFHEQYLNRDRRFALPQLSLLEKEFRRAEAWARENSVDIINATPDSALTVFRKVQLEAVLHEG